MKSEIECYKGTKAQMLQNRSSCHDCDDSVHTLGGSVSFVSCYPLWNPNMSIFDILGNDFPPRSISLYCGVKIGF